MMKHDTVQSKLESDGNSRTESDIREWLIQRIGEQVELDAAEIDTTLPFDSYGLNSIVAVRIAGEVEKFVGRTLSPALLFEHTSIDELARYLVELEQAEPAVLEE